MSSSPREACGVVGIHLPHAQVANSVFYGLFALQHRGQESAGIASSDGTRIYKHAGMGLVAQTFRDQDIENLVGDIAIGHTRYSTTGNSAAINTQPIIIRSDKMEIALGHNGNLINSTSIRRLLSSTNGFEPQSSTDSELIAALFAYAPGEDWFQRSAYCMARLSGAYSLVVMTKDELIGVRDPIGIRPLCLGKLDGGWMLASETAALDNIGAEFVRELDNGETIVIRRDSEPVSQIWSGSRKQGEGAMCVFEHIYFARPDSILQDKLAYRSRMRMGAELYGEHPVDADLVIPVPDSANAAAVGFAQASGIPYGEGLVRNRYVGRTFISPDQRLRELGVGMKFNAMRNIIDGKRLAVVDDSIVRGTTTPHVVKLLRRAGAKEIHLRISSPPIVSTCHFGVDMAATRDLLASNNSVEAIRKYLNADSLGYLSFDGLMQSVEKPTGKGLCSGCFTRRYPIDVQLDMDKYELENKPVAAAMPMPSPASVSQ